MGQIVELLEFWQFQKSSTRSINFSLVGTTLMISIRDGERYDAWLKDRKDFDARTLKQDIEQMVQGLG
jgi:hypothetical protein